MKIFERVQRAYTAFGGYFDAVTKARVDATEIPGAWTNIIERAPGDWQKGRHRTREDLSKNPAVYSCVTLISGDISKLDARLVRKNPRTKIHEDHIEPRLIQFFSRPNRYQTLDKFIEYWILQKYGHGNAYGLKVRNNRGRVIAVYPLDSARVQVCTAPQAEVWYRITTDHLSPIDDTSIFVPQSEVIHDLMNPLYHPLVGIPPITACALSAELGLSMQEQSAAFFNNDARPSGVIMAPHKIDAAQHRKIKEQWATNYGGANTGKVALLTDGLKYQPYATNSRDSQFVEQMQLSGRQVCMAYHIPPFKVGVEPAPAYQNAVATLNQIYFSDGLQKPISDFEKAFTDGLELPAGVRFKFDLDGLIQMDGETQMRTLGEGASKALLAPNEARQRLNLPPKPGGEKLWLQEQNWPMEDLAERRLRGDEPDAGEDPVAAMERQAQIAILKMVEEFHDI